jgi:hypothetical protein
MSQRVFTRKQAARWLNLSALTLKQMAAEGRGPAFSRTGEIRGRTLYAEHDLLRWLEQRKQTPAASAGKSQGG